METKKRDNLGRLFLPVFAVLALVVVAVFIGGVIAHSGGKSHLGTPGSLAVIVPDFEKSSELENSENDNLLLALANVVADDLGLDAEQRANLDLFATMANDEEYTIEEISEFLDDITREGEDKKMVIAVIVFQKSLGEIISSIVAGISTLEALSENVEEELELTDPWADLHPSSGWESPQSN